MLTENDTIDLENSQELSPEEAKAAMGNATFLMEQLMPQGQPEGDMEQESAPTEEKPQQTDNQPDQRIDEMAGEFKQFKEDINKTIDDKVSQLSDLIKEALIEEDGNEEK